MTLPVSGRVPEQGLRDAAQRLRDELPLIEADGEFPTLAGDIRAVLDALERPRPALPAPGPTHSPWEVERTYTRPTASTDNWGPGPYFVVRREPGEWCACSLVEERANAVRDALNALANGVSLTAQISKLVGDINNVFAPRIRELLAENDMLRAALPAEHAPPEPSEKAKLAGIEAAEIAANTPGWGLDGIPKAMIDAMCVAAIRAAYVTDHPNWGGLPAEPREPSAKAIEAASDVLRMPAKSYWVVGEDMIRPPRPDVGRALRAAYAVDCGSRPALAGSPPDLDGQEFYELMQAYRTAPTVDQAWVIAAFEAVKDYVSGRVSGTPEGTNP